MVIKKIHIIYCQCVVSCVKLLTQEGALSSVGVDVALACLMPGSLRWKTCYIECSLLSSNSNFSPGGPTLNVQTFIKLSLKKSHPCRSRFRN